MRNSRWLIVSVWTVLCLTACTAISPAPVTDLTNSHQSRIKGSYRGGYYIVNKGDTLYYISYIANKNVNDLIRYNHLTPPYTIHPNQKINLWKPSYTPPKYGKLIRSSTIPKVLSNHSLNRSKSELHAANLNNKHAQVKRTTVKSVESSKSKRYGKSISKENVNRNVNKNIIKPKIGNTKIAHWLWPTKGRLISKFSSGNQGNKGIDIAGRRGQSIVSAAAGTVVYSGNALRGYGNLIIIKHNDNYLSAYAHNERLLVKEGQRVNLGQKIATMGSSGTNNVRLHFEIRYQGKSVNPDHYLP